jgi:hypothetical protein
MSYRTFAPRNASYLPGRVGSLPRPATERQLSFLRSLREEIARLKNSQVAPEARVTGDALERWLDTSDVAADRTACSAKIEHAIEWRNQLRTEVKAQGITVAHAPDLPARTEVTEGMWIIGTIGAEDHSGIFKVQRAVHGSGYLYAKLLDPETSKFVYAPNGMRRLADEGRKLTLEEAKKYGALYGTCCVCGRTLTNEESIEAGIGPVCGGRL